MEKTNLLNIRNKVDMASPDGDKSIGKKTNKMMENEHEHWSSVRT